MTDDTPPTERTTADLKGKVASMGEDGPDAIMFGSGHGDGTHLQPILIGDPPNRVSAPE
jgi:hypothetical protein